MATTLPSKGTVLTYRNKLNSNKYVEVKKGNDGHSYIRQYIKCYRPDGICIKNYLASVSTRGRYYRSTIASITNILQDYELVA